MSSTTASSKTGAELGLVAKHITSTRVAANPSSRKALAERGIAFDVILDMTIFRFL